MGQRDLPGFRRLLSDRYGSAVAAWVTILDPEAVGRVTFGQLCIAVNQIGGYTGDPRLLWADLGGEQRGSFTLKNIFPEAYEDLEVFRAALLQRFSGGIQQAWHEGFDEKSVGRIDETLFCERCSALDLGLASKHKRLFKMLLPERGVGRRVLIEEDFTALLISIPVNQRGAVWKSDGPTAMVAPGSEGATTLAAGNASHLRILELLPLQTNELPPVTIEDFKRKLRRSFGSIWAGWVKYLDRAQVGRVPMSEFVRRARAIGISGNVKSLYKELDASNRGWITLMDLDAEVGEAVETFFAAAEEKYGSIGGAWKAAFNTGGSGHVGIQEFAKGCMGLGYAGNIEKLFAILKPEHGRTFLFLEDLGIGAKSRGRGVSGDSHEGGGTMSAANRSPSPSAGPA